MDSQTIIARAVAGTFACNIVALVIFCGLAARMSRLSRKIEQESGPQIQALRNSLARIESLADSIDQLIRDSAAPGIGNVEAAIQSFRVSAGNALKTPSGNAGALAVLLGASKISQMRRNALSKLPDEPISKGRSNRATAVN